MDQYLIYLRKSRADVEAEARGEMETLARHEKALVELSGRLKLNVTEIYREVVSGETIAARPRMQQLLSEVEQGIWSGVLVMEIERLARGDSIDQGIVAQAFRISGTKIITPSKTFDPSNEFDEEYFEFGLFMSRREYKTINRRIQRGRIASVKEGKFISSVAPYGYVRKKLARDKGFTLEVHPEQADVVRMIFEWYTVGELREDGSYYALGATRIARKLDSLGIKPLINNTWSRSSITDILKNPVYTGKIRWSYRKEVKVRKDGHIVKIRPNSDDYILVDGLHKPIIDQDTFDKAQQLLDSRSHSPIPGNCILKNPLTGVLYCGKCGTMMTRLAKSSKTPYDTVKCPNRYCDNISSPLYLVEKILIDELGLWLSYFKVRWAQEKLDIPYAKAIEAKETEISYTLSQLDKLREQRDRTYELLEQGIYTVEVFSERIQKLTAQIDSLQLSVHTLQKDLQRLRNQAGQNEIFIPRAEHILSEYYDLESASAKNEVLKEIAERIEYIKTEPSRKGDRDNANFKVKIYPRVIKF